MQEVSRCHFVEEKLQAALPKVTDFRNINQASRSKGEARDPEASEDPEVEVENLDDGVDRQKLAECCYHPIQFHHLPPPPVFGKDPSREQVAITETVRIVYRVSGSYSARTAVLRLYYRL